MDAIERAQDEVFGRAEINRLRQSLTEKDGELAAMRERSRIDCERAERAEDEATTMVGTIRCGDALDPCRDCYTCLRRDYDSQIPQWQERAFKAEAERDAARERVTEAAWALRVYVDWYAGDPFHEDGCPQDDTCGCPDVVRLNALLRALPTTPTPERRGE